MFNPFLTRGPAAGCNDGLGTVTQHVWQGTEPRSDLEPSCLGTGRAALLMVRKQESLAPGFSQKQTRAVSELH